MNSIESLRESINSVALHDGVLFLLLAGIGWVLSRSKPADQRSVAITLAVFAVSLAGQFIASIVADLGFSGLGKWLHETFLILEGVTAIRLCGMFAFRLLIPLLHMEPPRILEDIIVFIACLGWGFVRLHHAGLDLSELVTTSAIITAVIAFSMQDTLGNVLGGLALQLDDSIEVGDWIRVEDVTGKVVEIRWRHTAIETRNWETVIVPNSQLMKSKFSVLGRHGEDPVQLRRWIWFNVAYHTPPSRIINIVEDALRAADIRNLAKQPPPNCVLMEFDASYGRYAVRYWLTDLQVDDPTDSDVRDHIYAALQRAGILLAFPEYNVHMTKEGEKRELARQTKRIQERVDALRKVELFNGLREDELLEIAQKLKYAPFATGDVIIRQGAVAHWLYMLIDGEVDVFLETPGHEQHKLAKLYPGNFFGEMGLMTGAPTGSTVIASMDSECYLLDKESFETVLKNRPELAEEISKILVRRRIDRDSLQQELDADTRARQMAQQNQDMLSRVRAFFGLKSS